MADRQSLTLLLGWALYAIRGCKPYPVLSVNGSFGSAKTSTCEFVRMLIDPSEDSQSFEPRNEHELMILAANTHVITLNNLTLITPRLSDAFCRISDGGTFSARKLYSDGDRVLFKAARPLILNAIGDLINRPDLRSRTLGIVLPSISKKKFRPDKNIQREFVQAWPSILGAVYDALAIGIQRAPSIVLDASPRMIDFAVFGTALEPALGLSPGEFVEFFFDNQADAPEAGLDAVPIGRALWAFIQDATDWEGTATDLLARLTRPNASLPKDWPTTAKACSNQVMELQPSLSALGVSVTRRDRAGHSNKRTIHFATIDATQTATIGEPVLTAPSGT